MSGRTGWNAGHSATRCDATELKVNAASSCAPRRRDYHCTCALRARGPDRHYTQSANPGLLTRSNPLFAIDWLSRGVPVERETSVLTDLDAVVALTRSRAPEVAMRHPGREPDSFRLTGAQSPRPGHDGRGPTAAPVVLISCDRRDPAPSRHPPDPLYSDASDGRRGCASVRRAARDGERRLRTG